MKRTFTIILALLLTLALAGCSGGGTAVGTPSPVAKATLRAVGDIYLTDALRDAARCSDGSYDFSTQFSGIIPSLAEADLTLAKNKKAIESAKTAYLKLSPNAKQYAADDRDGVNYVERLYYCCVAAGISTDGIELNHEILALEQETAAYEAAILIEQEVQAAIETEDETSIEEDAEDDLDEAADAFEDIDE